MLGTSGPRPYPRIWTERLLLTIAGPRAAARQLRFVVENREHFAPWDPPAPAAFYTEKFWRERMQQNRREFLAGSSARFSVFAREDGAEGPVIAHVNFSQFHRGALQRCLLGYKIDHRSSGKGIMTEAVSAACDYVFQELRIHRIEANHRPENDRSAALLKRLGFSVEGYAREYLFIDGAWRDHVLNSLTNRALTAPEG